MPAVIAPRVLLPTAVFLTAACAGPPSFDEPHRMAIRDSVGVMLEAFRQYSAVGDWDALLRLYEDGPDFRWLEDGAVAYASVADIRAAIAAMPAGTRIVTTHDDVRITPAAPGTAWASMRFQSTFLGADGPSFGFAGVVTLLLRHRPEGWRIVGGHASTPREVRGADAPSSNDGDPEPR